MNWIELHDDKLDEEIFININNIEGVRKFETSSQIDVIDGTQYIVKETYEEVKNKIIYCDEYQYGTTSN